MFSNETLWSEPVSDCLSVDFLRDLALMHSRQGGEIGNRITPLIKGGKFAELCAFSIDYLYEGMTPIQFYHARQALACFQKLDFLDIGIDKKAAAIEKFLESEALCRETNEIFVAWRSGSWSFQPTTDRILSDAARFIAQVLGPVPQIKDLGLRFGPGATTLTKKRDASARRKLRDGLACSENLLPILPDILEQVAPWTSHMNQYYSGSGIPNGDPLHISGDVSLFDMNDVSRLVVDDGVQSVEIHSCVSLPVQLMDEELSFALKNAKILRPVSKPPCLTGMFQLAVGDYMSKRLMRFGLDLHDQSINQRLAKTGSLTGELATLDLSSASDTVAIELVHHLLPVDWFNFLNYGRCKYVVYQGDKLRMEKFASMGNGYTFPLESLIFWALARASCDVGDTVSVYGDDIIIPSRHYGVLKDVLTAVGFKLNDAKSFATGPFRESCGADWFRGFNIRPWYASTVVSLSTLFQLHNYCVRNGLDESREFALSHIPEEHRLFGPDGYGDGVLIGAFEPIVKASHRDRGYGGFSFVMNKDVNIREQLLPDPIDYIHALYSIYRRGLESHIDGKLLIEPVGAIDYAQMLSHKDFLSARTVPGLPIPTWGDGDYIGTKAVSLPGTNGSKRVLVYTLS